MDAFTDIGLNKYENQLYTALLKLKRSNAEKLSELSGVPITAVYPNLKTLCEKGLIQVFHSDPKEYSLIDPELSLNELARRKKEDIENKSKEAIKLSKSLYGYKRTDDKKHIVYLTKGREISKDAYLAAMEKAKDRYYIMGWRLEEIKDKYDLIKYFSKMIKRGVDVRIIAARKSEKTKELIKDYISEGIKIRYSHLDNFSLFVADGKICKITLKDKSLPDKYNIHILDENLSSAMQNYFLSIWDKADEIY